MLACGIPAVAVPAMLLLAVIFVSIWFYSRWVLFGIALIFIIQWAFLGDLRAALRQRPIGPTLGVVPVARYRIPQHAAVAAGGEMFEAMNRMIAANAIPKSGSVNVPTRPAL